jgi:hypothetical protein
MSMLTYTKFLESKSNIIVVTVNKYFLFKSELSVEEIGDEFLRLEEIFNTSIEIVCLGKYKHLENFNYFVSLREFNILNAKQNEELRRISRYLKLEPLENWFKEKFLDKMEIKKSKKFPDFIFYLFNNRPCMEFIKPYLLCSYDLYDIFSDYFYMEYDEIIDFIKEYSEKELKLNNVILSLTSTLDYEK